MAEGEEKYFNEKPSDPSAGSEYSLNPQIQSDIHEASIFPLKELTRAEQEAAATELEQKRLAKEGAAQPTTTSGNDRATRIKRAQQQLQTISSKITSVRKEAQEKNAQMGRLLRKKRVKAQEAETKLAVKIIRIIIEALSGIGIPLAIWEIIKLAKSSNDIRSLKKEQKKIKQNLIQNEIASKRKENEMEVEMYNLANILNSEAASDNASGGSR